MSLRHAVLGLLAHGSASGYDLTQQFQEALGTVWPAQHPKIYAELGRLDADHLIELDSRGPRGRKAYRITDAGRGELRRWLASEAVDHTLRLEPILRSFFFDQMSAEQLNAHLRDEAAFYTTVADQLRGYAAAKDRGEFGFAPHTQALRIAIEAGIRLYDALAGWAEWAGDTELAQANPDPANSGNVGEGEFRPTNP